MHSNVLHVLGIQVGIDLPVGTGTRTGTCRKANNHVPASMVQLTIPVIAVVLEALNPFYWYYHGTCLGQSLWYQT